MNLSKEAIEAIEKESATHYPTADNTNQLANMHTLGYCRGAKEALTNPEIYSKAGLIKKDEGLFTKKQMCDAFIDGNTDAHRPVERMFQTSNDWCEKKYPNYINKEGCAMGLDELEKWIKEEAEDFRNSEFSEDKMVAGYLSMCVLGKIKELKTPPNPQP